MSFLKHLIRTCWDKLAVRVTPFQFQVGKTLLLTCAINKFFVQSLGMDAGGSSCSSSAPTLLDSLSDSDNSIEPSMSSFQ